MVTRVSLTNSEDGQILVNKVALSGDRADRSAEAEWLSSANHSGVVNLVEFTSDPPTIVTAHAGTKTIRTHRPPPTEAARILAQVSTTLADLHGRSMVHGKLTPDHICLSGSQVALCSPSGNESDKTVDLVGLAKIVDSLLTVWAADKLSIDNETAWLDLASRLRQDSGPYGARRAIGAFSALGSEAIQADPAELTPLSGSGPKRKLLAAAVLVALAIAALMAWSSDAAPSSGVEFAYGPDRFSTASANDLVATTGSPCPGQPAAAVLETQTGIVWGFQVVAEGAEAESLMTVSGATSIEYRDLDGCEELWLTGPAGEVALSEAS